MVLKIRLFLFLLAACLLSRQASAWQPFPGTLAVQAGGQAPPAIIPLPQQLQWEPGNFPLQACRKIVVKDKALLPEAEKLRQILLAQGVAVKIAGSAKGKETVIDMQLTEVKAPLQAQEAYRLQPCL